MGAAALINHSRALSTSEVGLNFRRGAAQGLWSRLVPPTGTNRHPRVSTWQELRFLFFLKGADLGVLGVNLVVIS